MAVLLIIVIIVVIVAFIAIQEGHSSKNSKYVHPNHSNLDYTQLKQLWLKYEREYFSVYNQKCNHSSLSTAQKEEINKRIKEDLSNKNCIRFNNNVEFTAYLSDTFIVRNIESETNSEPNTTVFCITCFNDAGKIVFRTKSTEALHLRVTDHIHLQGPVIIGVGWWTPQLNSGNYSSATISLEQAGSMSFKRKCEK